MDPYVYTKWKAVRHLPIECLVNTTLLYARQRPIVQFDVTYYDKPNFPDTKMVRTFANGKTAAGKLSQGPTGWCIVSLPPQPGMDPV